MQHEWACAPITALASIGKYVLAGEGPYLHVYSQGNKHSEWPSLVQNHAVLLQSVRVFETQSVHGISIAPVASSRRRILVWGGVHVRLVFISVLKHKDHPDLDDHGKLLFLGPAGKAPDWILHLEFSSGFATGTEFTDQGALRCIEGFESFGLKSVALTAHNALLTVDTQGSDEAVEDSFGSMATLSITRVTATSRCILYSANLHWLSPVDVLVASGTAFGEILLWSCSMEAAAKPRTVLHHIFMAHEGSIFGIRISGLIYIEPDRPPRRLLASCSDDRTTRIWDITELPHSSFSENPQQAADSLRSRETGFGAQLDAQVEKESSNRCVAVAWGHGSRVWIASFLPQARGASSSDCTVHFLSVGEDATSRLWALTARKESSSAPQELKTLRLDVKNLETRHLHSGKNLWSHCLSQDQDGAQARSLMNLAGGADGQIIAHPIELHEDVHTSVHSQGDRHPRSDMARDFVRSIAFIGERILLLSTDHGHVIRAVLPHIQDTLSGRERVVAKISDDLLAKVAILDKYQMVTTESGINLALLTRQEKLRGFSIIASYGLYGRDGAIIADARGRLYCQTHKQLHTITDFERKPSGVFVSRHWNYIGSTNYVGVSLVGCDIFHIFKLDVDVPEDAPLVSMRRPISLPKGFIVTSFSLTHSVSKGESLVCCLGSRYGDIMLCDVEDVEFTGSHPVAVEPTVLLPHIHGKDAVTSVSWQREMALYSECLVTVGRDGSRFTWFYYPEKKLLVPFDYAVCNGLQMEVAPIMDQGPLSWGFKNHQWVQFNEKLQQEVALFDCGGGHRAWAHQYEHLYEQDNKEVGHPWRLGLSSTFAWIQARDLYVGSHSGSPYKPIKTGGHGREIKALAVSPHNPLYAFLWYGAQYVATGAEDTTIRLWRFREGQRECHKTLHGHTTGVQHLEWSTDGQYIFSSGGVEELYAWKVNTMSGYDGLGVVRESACPTISEETDLRITNFAIQSLEGHFRIAAAYSNSTIILWHYNVKLQSWQKLTTLEYTTSCMTQCLLLGSSILTTSTDGSVTTWTSENGIWGWEVNRRVKLHQNAIKALVTCALNDSCMLLITAGDDAAVGLMIVDLTHGGDSGITAIIPDAYAAAVTAAVVLDCTEADGTFDIQTATVGNDQRLILWNIFVNTTTGSIKVKKSCVMHTIVADASSIGLLDDGTVVVAGVGLETFRPADTTRKRE